MKILKTLLTTSIFCGGGLVLAPLITSCSKISSSGYVDVASYCDSTGQQDCADIIQGLIDISPNRTLWFKDGTYLLSHPIQTSSDPTKSVSLELSNFAVLKAAPGYQVHRSVSQDWQDEWNYMVQLGADRKNEQTEVGSNYYFRGGCIDGSGFAPCLEISGGRETCITDTNIKHAQIGIHLANGVNGSGSSDSDIFHVSIDGNDKETSIGLKIDSHDNSFDNIRIGHCNKGISIPTDAGNVFYNCHLLCNSTVEGCDTTSVGIDTATYNTFDYCYVDNFNTAFLLGREETEYCRCILLNCWAYWFGTSHQTTAIAIDNRVDKFESIVTGMHARFTATADGKENIMLKLSKPTTPEESYGRFEYLSLQDEFNTIKTDDAYKQFVIEK